LPHKRHRIRGGRIQFFACLTLSLGVPTFTMTTSELNIPLSMTLASALVQVGVCGSLEEVKRLLSAGAIRTGDKPLTRTHFDWELHDFEGDTIHVGRHSFHVVSDEVDISAPESELDSLRRKFSKLANHLRECAKRDHRFGDDGVAAGRLAAAEAIEELLSTPYL